MKKIYFFSLLSWLIFGFNQTSVSAISVARADSFSFQKIENQRVATSLKTKKGFFEKFFRKENSKGRNVGRVIGLVLLTTLLVLASLWLWQVGTSFALCDASGFCIPTEFSLIFYAFAVSCMVVAVFYIFRIFKKKKKRQLQPE